MPAELVTIFAAFVLMAVITEVRLVGLPPDPDPDAAAVDTAEIKASCIMFLARLF